MDNCKSKPTLGGGIKRTTAVLMILLMLIGICPQNNAAALATNETNRAIIYRYLINEMGLNSAAACGVLANIRYESSFYSNVPGDDGTSFGICQWHNNRKNKLLAYCEQKGYNYKLLEPQLEYLHYELKKSFPKVYNYLKSVPNNANGAYNAGYYWCYYYEVPDDRPGMSVRRGNYAKNTYWPEYNPDNFKATYSRVLKVTGGTLMSGNDVKYVQSCLLALGYEVSVDGWYGNGTAAAVKQFQKDNNLTADGKCGSATWSALEKTVSTKSDTLKITTQPTDNSAKIGDKVTFTVKASGVGLSYQWQLSDDSGKTWHDSSVNTATYSTTLTKDNGNRQVRCIVTDKYGNKATSNAATMKMTGAVAITKQPTDSSAKLGGQVSFSVTATGEGLSYQWQLSDDSGKTWRNSSTKTAAYTTTLTEANNGRYVRCIVTDKYSNKVTSNAAAMKVNGIAITKQPTDSSAEIGKQVSFSVTASGIGLSYQWQLSDDNGKTWRDSSTKTAAYATTLTEANDGRYVRCIITDKNGSKVTSNAAVMKSTATVKTATISNELKITQQPVNCTVKQGGQVTFTVKASGTGLSYQWQLSDDAGKTWRNSSVKTAAYATTLTETNVGRYVRCIVTDKNGTSVTSNAAVMNAK